MSLSLGKSHYICLLAFAGLVTMGAARMSANAAPAADSEQRSYDVLIDNRAAGHYQLQFTTSGDAVEVGSACDIDYRFLIFHYRYTYRGHEHWQAAALQGLDSESNDDGKRCSIVAKRKGSQFEITVNGNARQEPGDLRTSSYWHSPPTEDYAGKFLEVDTGKLMQVRFQFVDTQNLQFGQRQLACKHYKLTGDDPGEVWYDARQRIVRQISATDGHKTEVRLSNITNSAG